MKPFFAEQKIQLQTLSTLGTSNFSRNPGSPFSSEGGQVFSFLASKKERRTVKPTTKHDMRKCKICKKELKGRVDKLFCSIECKNYYHVSLRKVTNKFAKVIDKTLHRNHSILLEILGKNSTQKKVNRSILTDKKFNFKYHTHFNINCKGKTYFFLYDIAWMEFSDDIVLIVRKR